MASRRVRPRQLGALRPSCGRGTTSAPRVLHPKMVEPQPDEVCAARNASRSAARIPAVRGGPALGITTKGMPRPRPAPSAPSDRRTPPILSLPSSHGQPIYPLHQRQLLSRRRAGRRPPRHIRGDWPNLEAHRLHRRRDCRSRGQHRGPWLSRAAHQRRQRLPLYQF